VRGRDSVRGATDRCGWAAARYSTCFVPKLLLGVGRVLRGARPAGKKSSPSRRSRVNASTDLQFSSGRRERVTATTEVNAMVDPIQEIKVRAEILQKRIEQGDTSSLARLRVLPELRKATPEALQEFVTTIQRKHCLAVASREFGFAGYQHAVRVLSGDEAESDFGTLLYPGRCGALNHWYATYEEARDLRREVNGYLLAYKRHFFVADGYFVASLGLDPADPDWDAIGRDWVKPCDPVARRRLYSKLVGAAS
jgi:hypothetical protein